VESLGFADALRQTQFQRRYLLLGNSFSIGAHPAFGYASLFAEAVARDPGLATLFPDSDPNFEKALERWGEGAHADRIREALIRAVAAVHPERSLSVPEEQCLSCRDFLEHFVGRKRVPLGGLFTTNYDMLLHWVLSRQGKNSGTKQHSQLKCWDGFASNGEWNPIGAAQAHYLHGAVHIYELPQPRLPHLNYTRMLRYEWGRPLLKQVDGQLRAGRLPVFVAEGNSQRKKARQRQWEYLAGARARFRAVCIKEPEAALFAFGHSFGGSDDHIVEQIGAGVLRDVFIGVYSDEDRRRAAELAERWTAERAERGGKPVRVRIYDSADCRVWAVADRLISSSVARCRFGGPVARGADCK